VKIFFRLHYCAAFLPLILFIAGCLSDPIDRPEVKPRIVTPPPRAWIVASNFQPPVTGDLIVRWNHAASDTQQNFKGYHVRLYASDTSEFNDILGAVVAETIVLKIGNKVDTSVVFPGVTLGHYTAYVHGIKFADTLALSADSIPASGFFDPRPLLNPTAIRATSIDRHSVKLEWDVPTTDTNSGLKGYQIYFNDPERLDSAHTGPLVPRLAGRSALEATISGLPELKIDDQNTQPERAFRFWVKSVRNDDVQFSSDTSSIIWSGAARVPLVEDSGGFRHSLYFGNFQQSLNVVDDSTDALGHIMLTFNGNSVTLSARNGAKLNSRIDTSSSLDTITYSAPIVTNFDLSDVTLAPAAPGLNGLIVYLEIPNIRGSQYARIWIQQQSDGSFVTSRGGIYIRASYQTGLLASTPYTYY
jgi:hypothetical protein